MAPSLSSPADSLSRSLFEAAPDGIFLVDPVSRQILDANPSLLKILGRTREELLGREMHEVGLCKDEAAGGAAFRELLSSGCIHSEDWLVATKDDRRVEVEFVSTLSRVGEQQVIRANVRDLTARKAREKALCQANLEQTARTVELEKLLAQRTAELRNSNARMETVVHSIVRDLRAPLQSMQGFTEQLVQNHGKSLPPAGRDSVNRISKAAQVMDRLLADLNAFNLIGRQKIELAPVALETVVQSALSGCESAIMESEAQIESRAPWPAVVGHATMLREVLVNLIGNAVKFVVGKEPRVRLRTEERPDGIVRIWVEDNGIGISPEFHERIFHVFQRVHTTSYAGTGIGLAIVKKGVERMGGQVGLESVPGEGSRFWVDLAKAAPVVLAS